MKKLVRFNLGLRRPELTTRGPLAAGALNPAATVNGESYVAQWPTRSSPPSPPPAAKAVQMMDQIADFELQPYLLEVTTHSASPLPSPPGSPDLHN